MSLCIIRHMIVIQTKRLLMLGLRCNTNFLRCALLSILVTIVLHSCEKKSTLLEDYKNEISALQTEVEIKSYWNKLYLKDQESLKIDSDSVKKFDSISITQMM